MINSHKSTTKTAIILAGGLGTRLKSVVSDLPKPMAPVNGKPFIEIIMDYWINQGIQKFILSLCYLNESFISYFGDFYKKIPIIYSIEEIPLGTGGGLLHALNKINKNEQFLVINGDTYFDIDLYAMESFHFINNSDWTFALFNSSDNSRYTPFELSSNSHILKVNNSNEIKVSNFYSNGGIYLINNKNIFNGYKADSIKKSLETDIIPEMISNRKLFGYVSDGLFIDIGLPGDYIKAHSVLSNQLQ